MPVGAVIVASGYGTCRNFDGMPVPKVIENIGGVPMIVRVAISIHKAGLSRIIVVINPIYGERIRLELGRWGFGDCRFVVQETRSGAADAVSHALPTLLDNGYRQTLVVYADMPLWRSETIRNLVHSHVTNGPTVSMVSVSLLNQNTPDELARYGRIIRSDNGRIQKVIEPCDASEDILQSATEVNPSLWVWECEWLLTHINRIPWAVKHDGYTPERHMPRLIEFASYEHRRILAIPLKDPTEALGVNSAEELEEVRRIFSLRNSERK